MSYPSMLGTSSCWPARETLCESGIQREVCDKEKGTGKQKRRAVTYDMSKISAALPGSEQDQQSEKDEGSNLTRERRKKEKRSSPKKGSPLASKRRAKKIKKQKDKKRKKSSSTSSSSNSKDSSGSTSSSDSADYPPGGSAIKLKKGSCNPYRNRWTGKIEKYSGIADGSIDTWLELMKERLDGSSMSEKDKILTIKDHLTGEAREFLMNKSQEERKKLSRVFKL